MKEDRGTGLQPQEGALQVDPMGAQTVEGWVQMCAFKERQRVGSAHDAHHCVQARPRRQGWGNEK